MQDGLELDGEELDEVETFAYLAVGSNISKDGWSDRYIQLRIGKAKTVFTVLSPVWKSKTISSCMHGSETKATSNKLLSFVNKCLRSIMGIQCRYTGLRL